MALPTLTVFGFAAGSGMLERAVVMACDAIGVRSVPVGYVEREAHAAAVIVAAMGETTVGGAAIWDDARTFDGRRWRGCVDIFTAGYPCQPFSLAGKRLGESDPRHLWPEVRRVIEEMQPELLFLENVSAHLTLGFDTVASELAGLGYSVTPGLFTASETGASHRRERLFILGLANAELSGPQQSETDRRDRTGGAVVEGSGDMDVAECRRCEGAAVPTDERTDRAGVRRSAGASDEVADGAGAGPPRRKGEPGDAGQERQAVERDSGGLPLHAPGRNDWPAWEAVAGLAPSVMPSIERPVRGVADGLASRADRLRCVGNGVDALAAAYAFLTLLACATGGG